MRSLRLLPLLGSLLLAPQALPPPAGAQGLAALRDIEDRLLQRRIDAYRDAHRAEVEAASRLQTAVQRLYEALGDRSVEVDELRALEDEVAVLRETAVLRARLSTDLRLELYSRMERLDELDRVLGRVPNPLQGTWTLDLGEEGTGAIRFRSDGDLVEGVYQLEDSGSGTLRGTIRGLDVELEHVESASGMQRTFFGRLSPDGTSIRGTWQAKELATGAPASGPWTARRVAGSP